MQILPLLTLETMAAVALANRLHRRRRRADDKIGIEPAAANAGPKPTSADAWIMAGWVLLASALMVPAILGVAGAAWLSRELSWRH